MEVRLPYNGSEVTATLPDGQVVGICTAREMEAVADPDGLLRRAILTGLEECDLASKVGPGARACIAVTDRTRSTPNKRIVPILLDALNALGIPDGRITVMSAGGMHTPDTREDLLDNLGPAVMSRVEVITSEPNNETAMVHLGETTLGTPVEVHRRFAEADIKIGVSNINPCMLAGWSGGGKIVQPGVSSSRSINHNHSLFVEPLMELGAASLLGVMPPLNIVRVDIEECATIAGLDMSLNTVLNTRRELVDAFCGEHVTAHRAAVKRMAPYIEVALPQRVDVLLAGIGDPAFEISLYQGGSRVCGGVDRCLKPGGTLIMLNACREGIYEGFGREEFREWMRLMPAPGEIKRRVESGELSGEEGCVLFAFSWLLREMGCRLIVVAEGMTEAELREIHMDYAPGVRQALDEALRCYPSGASVGVIPHGGLVLPKFLQEKADAV